MKKRAAIAVTILALAAPASSLALTPEEQAQFDSLKADLQQAQQDLAAADAHLAQTEKALDRAVAERNRLRRARVGKLLAANARLRNALAEARKPSFARADRWIPKFTPDQQWSLATSAIIYMNGECDSDGWRYESTDFDSTSYQSRTMSRSEDGSC